MLLRTIHIAIAGRASYLALPDDAPPEDILSIIREASSNTGPNTVAE